MKLRACYRLPALALVAAAPAWANYSWGQMALFRPGIQLGIVLLVLLTEVLVVKPLVRMSWGVTVAAVVGANLLSAAIGFFFVYEVNFMRLVELVGAAIPSTIVEFVVVASVAEKHSAWPRYKAHRAFAAVFAANLLSALMTFGYVYANYGGRGQPMLMIERGRMVGFAQNLAAGRLEYGGDFQAFCDRGRFDRFFLRRGLLAPTREEFDMAPAWLPWAQMRSATRYESALPRHLDPRGRGRPMIWPGAPYLNGKRGVIFSDGSYREMSERDFQKLGAVPSPPQVTIPAPEPHP